MVGMLVGVLPFASASSSEGQSISAQRQGNEFSLSNRVVGARWTVQDRHLRNFTFVDSLHARSLQVASAFSILLKDGTIYRAEDLLLEGEMKETPIVPHPEDSTYARTLPGRQFQAAFVSADHHLRIDWKLELLQDSQYVRQTVTIITPSEDLPISRVELVNAPLQGARVSGWVKGSPIVTDEEYLGFEHPISESRVESGTAWAWIDRDLPLRAGQSITYSSVFGVVHKGQMRREFLEYIERERAHPYRTFLHYNSWYDLGYFTPYTEAEVVNRIHAFGEELTTKRGVKLDSFLFDDGWDNHHSLWQFNDGFPRGFTPVRKAAEEAGASPGVWMSPWGGYSKPKQERIAYGTEHGYEIVRNGYALSGPKYYAAFRDVAMEMVTKYGVNQFKIDGTGNVDSVFPGSSFDSDFSAAIHLIEELRAQKPSLFINLTTGTWPSPYWLKYSDSIWRGGEDDDFTGVGSYRERWITYRDGDTYRRVVLNGPLFPLNSLMLHGIIYARFHKHLNTDPGNDFRNEVRSYFGTGTQLQEMYITPSLLSKANWDDLAEAATWSRENAGVLRDTHWVGGDPAWLEVYGWAAWTSDRATLVLRNPSDKQQSIALKLADIMEMPQNAKQTWSAKSPWKDDAGHADLLLDAQQLHTFHLKPFEVVTLDLKPRSRS